MSNESSIFPIPQHFTDYGFEPQIQYFQVLEEARKHKAASRSLDIHFKLQKPISKDENSKKIKKSKRRWWRHALYFFKFPKRPPHTGNGGDDAAEMSMNPYGGGRRSHHHRIASLSGPVYVTESRSSGGASTPYTTASRPGSGPLEIPYISLREVNVEHGQQITATSAPIYFVT